MMDKQVMATAMRALMVPEHEMVDSVARAILAERERCAKVADACRDRATSQPLFPLARNLHTQAETAQRIADAIRGGQSHD